MKKQVVHISPHQFGKITALTIGLVMLPSIPIGFLTLLLGGKDRWSGVPFILFPIFYALTWYLWTALLSWIYNLVAKRYGGIEITLADPEEKSL